MEFLAWFGKIELEERYWKSPDNGLSFQPNLRLFALTNEVASADQDYNSSLRAFALDLVKRQLFAGVSEEADILQGVAAIDDIYAAINLLDERLYEWSRLRSQEILHGKALAAKMLEDENAYALAEANLCLRDAAVEMEREISTRTDELAPNLSSLAGPILAARLILRAGSLESLARMPASRIQVMGAEKSLFKHLLGNATSPKHGLIFRHPAVAGSAKKIRGKIARVLAGKLALAARLDFFGKELNPLIKADMEKRLMNIKLKGKSPNRKK